MPIKRKPKKEPKYHDSPPPSPSQDPNPPSPRKLRYLKAMKEMAGSYTCHICKSLILIAFSTCETHTTVCSFCRLPCCSEPTSMIQIFCRKGLHDTYIRRCFSAAKNTDLEKSVRDEHEKQVEVINKWIKEERLKGYGVQAIDSEEEADPEDFFGVLGDVKTEVKTEKLEKEEKKVEIEGRIVREIIKAEELGMVEGEENEEMKDSDEEMQQEIEQEMHHVGEDKIDEGRKKNQESEKEKIPREESPDTQREGQDVKIPNPKDSEVESQASKNKLSDTSNSNKTLHKKPSLEHDKAKEPSQKLLQNKEESKPLLQKTLQKQKLDTSKEISNPKPKESTKPPQNPTNNPKPEQISHQEKPKASTKPREKPQNFPKHPQKKESSKKKLQESSLVAQKQKTTPKEIPKETPKISKTSQIHPETTERVPQEQKDSGATLSKEELRDKLLKDCQLDEDIEEETKASNKGGKSEPLPVEEVKEISKRKKKEQEELANKLYQESVDSINKGSVKPLPKPVKKIPATESKPPQPQKLVTSQSPDLSKKQDVEMESEQPTEPTELSPDPFQRAIDKDIKRIRDILDPFIQKIPEDMEVDEAIEIFRDCHKVSSLAIDTVRLFLEMRKTPEDISIPKKEIEDVRIELGNLADINYEKVIKGVKAKYQEIKFTARRIAIPDSCEKDYYITEVSKKSDAGDQNYKAKLIFSVTEYTQKELSKMSIQTTKIPSLKPSITTRSKLQKACNIHLQVHRKCLASCYSHLHINLRLNSVPLRYKLRTFTAPGTSTITLGISNLIPKSLLHNLNSPTSLTISLSFYTSSPCTSRLRSSSISTASSASCLTTARAEPAKLAQKAVQVMLEEEVMKKRLEEKEQKEQRVKDLEEQVRILKGIMEEEKKMKEKENEERRIKVKKRMEERREKKDKESGKREKRNVEEKDEEEDQGKKSKEESLEEEKKKEKSEKEENFKKIADQEDKQKEISEQELKLKMSSLVKKKAKEPSKTKKKLKKDSSQNAKPRRSPDKKKRERKLKEKSANKSKEINKRDKSKPIKKKAEKESKHSEIKKIGAPADTVSTPRFPNSSRESRKLKRNKRSSPANTPTPKSSESISQPKVGKKLKSSQKRNTSKLRKNKKETQKSYRRQKPSPPRKHYSRKYAKKDSKSRYSKSPTPSKGKSSKSNTQIPSSSRPRKSYGYFGFSGNNHKSQNEDPQNISIPEHDSDADIQSPDNSPKNSPPAKLRRSRRPKPWAEEASMTPTSPKEEPKRKPRKKSKGKSKPKAKAKDKSKKKSKKNKKSRKKD